MGFMRSQVANPTPSLPKKSMVKVVATAVTKAMDLDANVAAVVVVAAKYHCCGHGHGYYNQSGRGQGYYYWNQGSYHGAPLIGSYYQNDAGGSNNINAYPLSVQF